MSSLVLITSVVVVSSVVAGSSGVVGGGGVVVVALGMGASSDELRATIALEEIVGVGAVVEERFAPNGELGCGCGGLQGDALLDEVIVAELTTRTGELGGGTADTLLKSGSPESES